MDSLSPKERLLRVLNKEEVGRPPVICAGGMMNAAIVEIMTKTGHVLPDAHLDDRLMSGLAYDVHQYTEFENLGVPFCMTVEAEILGSEVDYGSLSCEPKILREAYPSVSEVAMSDVGQLVGKGRLKTVFRSINSLHRQYPDLPVLGNLTGPISTAASVVDPIQFLKELRKDREKAHRVLGYVANFLTEYARLMVDNGATVVAIGDPTSTGEILGPRMFEEYAVRYLNQVIESVHLAGAPVIVHICGNMNSVKHLIPAIKADAISTDALVNLRLLKEEFPQLTTMGNVSTYLLQNGPPDRVRKRAARLVEQGVDIISPACGLSTSTSLDNILAMTRAVKESPARCPVSLSTPPKRRYG